MLQEVNTVKTINVTKKTHAYILPDGTVVRAIGENTVKEYQKEGKQVYSAKATKTVDGAKVETTNYYVATSDFVKRSTARTTLASKLAAITDGVDLSKMTAAELLAQLG